MAASGCYPKLDLNQVKELSGDSEHNKNVSEEDKGINLTEAHSSPAQVVSLHSTADGIAPPSPLFAPSPDTEDRELGSSFPDTAPIPASYSTCAPDHFSQLSAFPEN